MKYLKRSVVLLTLLICTSIFAQTPISATEKLGELLNQFTTFEANFTQTTTDTQQHIVQRSHGRMMMDRPGHFRWETQSPSHQIIITNGKKLWVYDVDLKQATEQSVANSPVNPAKLLSGNTAELLQQFTVHLVPHRSLTVFQLIPKKANQQFRSVAMVFSHNQLQQMQIENNAEQTTTFNFSDIKLNAHLSPELFEFKAGAGVDVLR
jgi:outer membrane lipoprotein carrier protein